MAEKLLLIDNQLLGIIIHNFRTNYEQLAVPFKEKGENRNLK